MPEFNPIIIAFVCNWCSYAGADLAGGQKLECPSQVKLVRVMCSGRVDPQMVLETFRRGADGVMVLGCHPGDCHYRNGNMKTLRRMRLLERTIGQFGIDPERLMLDWVSAGEGEKFQQVTNIMTERIKALGPLKIRGFVKKEAAS